MVASCPELSRLAEVAKKNGLEFEIIVNMDQSRAVCIYKHPCSETRALVKDTVQPGNSVTQCLARLLGSCIGVTRAVYMIDLSVLPKKWAPFVADYREAVALINSYESDNISWLTRRRAFLDKRFGGK